MKRCLIFMLLLGLLLTGCRKQTQPEQLPAAETAGSQTETESDVQTPERTLMLGTIDFDTEKSVLRSMIQNYNFSGAPVRIEILNYADGAESRADAVTRMTTELLAGNVPDLLDCSDLSGAQYAGYAKNGILLPLDGMPVLAHTLRAVDAAQSVDEIVIAAREEDLLTYAELCKTYGIRKPVKVVVGGATRQESVLRAALEARADTKLLAVQDGARPLVTPELFDAVVLRAAVCAAAAPAVPVHDTIKLARDRRVTETPDRSMLFAVQTPQVFDAGLLKAALQSALTEHAALTDDCSAVERLGKAVYLTDGDEENIKITTPLDLIVAETILRRREEREAEE